jgi:Mg2+/Co2+ transporter CorC
MKYPTIESAKVVDNHTLLVEFCNQEQRQYDITPLLNKEVFLPLSNPAFFKNFRVEQGGYAIVWNEDIDISEYELWMKGIPVPR